MLEQKELLILFLGGLVAYIAIITSLYFAQRKFVYFPDPRVQARADYGADQMSVVKVTTEDGLALSGWYHPPEGDKPVIVVFHGNASHMGMSAWKVRPYIEQGYGALLPAYRGYAGNPGKPTEQGLYRDARAFLAWLREAKGIPENRIVLYGESLGTGVAVEMAATHYKDIKALILESPYTSFTEMARRQYFFVPFVALLVRDRYSNIDKIAGVKAPLLIVAGKLDMIVPVTMGRKLFAAANEPKAMVEVPAAGHNNLYMHGAEYRVLHFLSGL